MGTTQKEKIIAYCKEHGSITAREAFIKLNINSPRKLISDIRQSGEYIVDTLVESKEDEFGHKVRWNRYYIKKKVLPSE